MIKEIQHKFNLFFEGAENSEGKLTIKFSSVNQRENENQVVEEDELSKVYGQPSSKEHLSGNSASTIHEMIKENKYDMIAGLLKIMGAKS